MIPTVVMIPPKVFLPKMKKYGLLIVILTLLHKYRNEMRHNLVLSIKIGYIIIGIDWKI